MADSDPHIQPGFAGVVGPVITAENLDGKLVRTVAPGFIPLNSSGQPAGPTAAAQDTTGSTKPALLTFLGHQLGLAVDTSTALIVPPGTRYAQIQARAQAVRYRYDGATTPPTASSGLTLAAGAELDTDVDLTAFRAIGVIAGAFLDVAYFS